MASEEEREEFQKMLNAQSVEETRLDLKEQSYNKGWKIGLAEEHIRRAERNLEDRRQLGKDISRLSEKVDSRRSGLLRMAILGNAGGTIATLSFMGTIIGGSKTFGYDALAILICFIVGLVSGAFGRAVEWKISSETLRDAVRLSEDGGTVEDLYGYPAELEDQFKRRMGICYFALAVGTIGGLIYLAQMAAN